MKSKNMEKADSGKLRYLSQSIRLKEEGNPALVTGTVTIVCATLALLGIWAAFSKVSEIARAAGEIVPSGYEQVVQHLEGGIIRVISVREGDTVAKGQILIEIDGGGARSDLERARDKDALLALEEERQRAFIENRSPSFTGHSQLSQKNIGDATDSFRQMIDARDKEANVIRDQIRQKKLSIQRLQTELGAADRSAAIAASLLQKRRNLNAEGLLSDVRLLETEQRYNETQAKHAAITADIAVARSALGEYEARLTSLNANKMDEAHEKLASIMAEKLQNREIIAKLEDRISRLQVTSPASGIVKGLAVNTIGEVVTPGATLMHIIPHDEKLVVSLKIPPRHIGHLKPGQSVEVKFSSYDFARYGAVRGKLQSISASTFEGADGERFYQGRVELDRSHVGESADNKIMPGMTVMADIVTGSKTVMQYLLRPIQTAMSTALTER